MEKPVKSALGTMISIAIAEDVEHARACQHLLKEREIEAVIKPQAPGTAGGVLIQVGEEWAEEAQCILERQNRPGDFYDFDFYDATVDHNDDE